MRKNLLAISATLLFASPALAGGVLWDNGPFVTHPGGHQSGADVSQLQNVTIPGHTTLGFTMSQAFRTADDFTIPSGQSWTLTGVRVYGYQTSQNLPATGGNVRIWQGDPGAGGVLVYDGSANNTLVSSTFRAYRIAESTNAGPPFTDTARAVHENTLSIPNIVLGPGQYWIDWNLVGPVPTSAVFGPPVTRLGQANTGANGFARQWNGSAWSGQLMNGTGGTADLPFILLGEVPAPGALALLGIAGLAARRRRRA